LCPQATNLTPFTGLCEIIVSLHRYLMAGADGGYGISAVLSSKNRDLKKKNKYYYSSSMLSGTGTASSVVYLFIIYTRVVQ
jgi:hypothetical protein